MSRLKIIISGGGTGGHIFPAIAIANALKKLAPQTEFLFVGALGKMEMEKVPQAGYNIIGLPIAGLQRRLTLKNLFFPFKVIRSLLKARDIIRQFQPDVAVGVGGYASGPLLHQAAALGITCLIQEQNSYPGITNKLLAKRVQKICVAYPGMERFFPQSKIVVTGNPVRALIKEGKNKKGEGIIHFQLNPNLKTVLVIGGSLGARTINESIAALLPSLKEQGLQLIWQTGKFYFTQAMVCSKSCSEHVKVFDFIERMDLAYSCADFVVSRAGALSVSELCVVGKPCILIPSPNVSEDHQTKNAMALVEQEAALLVKDINAKEELPVVLHQLMVSEDLQVKLAKNIAKLAVVDADETIANEILRTISLPKQSRKK
jgi:UDP-N-acetylglucosamine--N-acetylmuramyl-(pentapeptide) pyrophosphoryl-undecaprenol N-acetylglucosamine transferase